MSAISDICAQASLVVLFKDHSILGYEKKKPHFKYVFFNYNQDSREKNQDCFDYKLCNHEYKWTTVLTTTFPSSWFEGWDLVKYNRKIVQRRICHGTTIHRKITHGKSTYTILFRETVVIEMVIHK